MSGTPTRRARSSRASTWERSSAIGFSTSTGLPSSSARVAHSTWEPVGEATINASIPRKESSSGNHFERQRSASASPAAGSGIDHARELGVHRLGDDTRVQGAHRARSHDRDPDRGDLHGRAVRASGTERTAHGVDDAVDVGVGKVRVDRQREHLAAPSPAAAERHSRRRWGARDSSRSRKQHAGNICRFARLATRVAPASASRSRRGVVTRRGSCTGGTRAGARAARPA